MCGIMGYLGERPAKDIIYTGLKRLEYRGYDSAGVAVLTKDVQTIKAVGDTSKLDLTKLPKSATIGIGHTRWATHGRPSAQNAHPHTYGDITLVHNGIIENYQDIKDSLKLSDLKSQTDSEVLAALINNNYQKGKISLIEALKRSLVEVSGTFGLVVMSPLESNQLLVARRGSPIVIGVGDKQNFVASDPSAIISHTDKVIYLEDDQIAQVTRTSIEIFDLKLKHKNPNINRLSKSEAEATLGHYKTYLEKEIKEQPESLKNLMRGRVSQKGTVKLGGPNLDADDANNLEQILIIGCGTSYYAGLYAKYKLEEMLNMPVIVEHASEFRYRHGAYKSNSTLAIFISQSGETADVLASIQEAKRRHLKTMGIVNTIGSSVARAVEHGGIYLHAGQEVSVASTKAYSSMVSAILMFGAQLVYQRGGNSNITKEVAKELLMLPSEIKATFELHENIKKLTKQINHFEKWFYLGRNSLYPVALEGALKLTEVSYIHAQAFPTGEMKHGPISLVDNKHISILLLPEDETLYEKGISALEELIARGGTIFTISTRPKPKSSNYHLQVTYAGEYTEGLIYNICLQLLALEVATIRGVNIDRPRNLAKSVTVE